MYQSHHPYFSSCLSHIMGFFLLTTVRLYSTSLSSCSWTDYCLLYIEVSTTLLPFLSLSFCTLLSLPISFSRSLYLHLRLPSFILLLPSVSCSYFNLSTLTAPHLPPALFPVYTYLTTAVLTAELGSFPSVAVMTTLFGGTDVLRIAAAHGFNFIPLPVPYCHHHPCAN